MHYFLYKISNYMCIFLCRLCELKNTLSIFHKFSLPFLSFFSWSSISGCSRIPLFNTPFFHVPVTNSNFTNAVFFCLFIVSVHVLLSGLPNFCSMETATCFAFCFCVNEKSFCCTDKSIENCANKLDQNCTRHSKPVTKAHQIN